MVLQINGALGMPVVYYRKYEMCQSVYWKSSSSASIILITISRYTCTHSRKGTFKGDRGHTAKLLCILVSESNAGLSLLSN